MKRSFDFNGFILFVQKFVVRLPTLALFRIKKTPKLQNREDVNFVKVRGRLTFESMRAVSFSMLFYVISNQSYIFHRMQLVLSNVFIRECRMRFRMPPPFFYYVVNSQMPAKTKSMHFVRGDQNLPYRSFGIHPIENGMNPPIRFGFYSSL